MKKVIFKGTKETPYVKLDKGIIEFKGRSIPEDPNVFYNPIIDWIKNYINELDPLTKINISLEYINTSSSKSLLTILKMLNSKCCDENKMIVNWSYEDGDDDMRELGYFIETLLNIPFEFIENEELSE